MNTALDTAQIESQIAVMRSEKIATMVIDAASSDARRGLHAAAQPQPGGTLPGGGGGGAASRRARRQRLVRSGRPAAGRRPRGRGRPQRRRHGRGRPGPAGVRAHPLRHRGLPARPGRASRRGLLRGRHLPPLAEPRARRGHRQRHRRHLRARADRDQGGRRPPGRGMDGAAPRRAALPDEHRDPDRAGVPSPPRLPRAAARGRAGQRAARLRGGQRERPDARGARGDRGHLSQDVRELPAVASPATSASSPTRSPTRG